MAVDADFYHTCILSVLSWCCHPTLFFVTFMFRLLAEAQIATEAADVAEKSTGFGTMQGAQLWMVAGFLILGWVLARRQMRMGKRVNREARAANRQLEKMRNRKEPVLPLSDAPPETQRWQVAMFDLQRELTAELDTRISIVQTLLHQVDQKIVRLEELEASTKAKV